MIRTMLALCAAAMLAGTAANAQTDTFAEMTFDGFHLAAPSGWEIQPQDPHLPILMLTPTDAGDRPDWVALVGIESLGPDALALPESAARGAALFDAEVFSTSPAALVHGDGLAVVFQAGTAQIGSVAFRRLAVPGRFGLRDLDFQIFVYETGILNDDAFVPTRSADALIHEAARIADGFTVDG